MPARKSPWLNARANLLKQTLSEQYGLSITEDTAREDVSAHVDFVAERMRIQRRAAKAYVTEDVIRGLAEHIAECVQDALAAEPDSEPKPPRLRVVDPE
ncbi:Uncharacterised protein [Mycobacteroides abscessus subsp. abscessus]|uniref:hypothetical protein n=1 Tax=Mycobacteroides abscessus TaxID=36809 RepID=UPI00078CCFA0|nr:hypothetical protein [Mycobacteroides abscessus]AMU59018.1 hypothetical protein A3O03_01675 [Mycobacteroides abscessus]SID30728.1 Uncharacterised protein [Mycobacteroides abscessus subsp. abscessus]SID69915.1 Uncharacterised protein [Mycobacteroides abscessus subsp. abscessus]SKG37311.1 Uncharacterised protein [Mycobacteroides abscessus subsp. abscessus]SKQ81496.1 Uncharacterised protein [Mycobacteroides abscessus subsp. abscessus]